eukprot:SAG31_NODE_3554_length_4129_cov_2.346402_2_plen_83_part_00
MNQTEGEFSQFNMITENLMHSFGVYGKQTAYFQSIAAHNVIAKNIIFNGPRVGVCLGTGFVGGNLLEGYLLFNLVQETHAKL